MKFHCGSVYKFSKTIDQAIHEEFPQRGERERLTFIRWINRKHITGKVSSILASNLVIMKVSGMEFLAKEA